MPQNPHSGGGSGSGSGRKPPGPVPPKPQGTAQQPPRRPTNPLAGPVSRPATSPGIPAGRPPSNPNVPVPRRTSTLEFSGTSSGVFGRPVGFGNEPTSPSQPKLTPKEVPRSATLTSLPRTISSPNLEARKRLQQTGFEDEPTQYATLLGARRTRLSDDDDEQKPTSVNQLFDGERPAQGVTTRELIAINAPLQSREGRRSEKITLMVIDQFAAGHNPRYDPDPPDRTRGHIFIWDVTRALNAEVPHFFGGREQSLAQTCNWIRQEGPGKGWFRVQVQRACEALAGGMPVLVVPRDVRITLLAVARPGEFAPDGKPMVSAVARKRGRRLTSLEALGVPLVDYYMHA